MTDEQQLWIEEMRQFTVCQLCDALGHDFPVETSVIPVESSFRVCGPALTVECAPGDNLTLHHALHLAQPGDVLIVSGAKNCDAALWGELMSISAKSKRLEGTIVDGAVRDAVEIRALGYPVFCRQFTPRRAAKEQHGKINVPVHIGTLSVSPGDLIIADANGIVSLPPRQVKQTLQSAAEVLQKEATIKQQIVSGRSIFEILNLGQALG